MSVIKIEKFDSRRSPTALNKFDTFISQSKFNIAELSKQSSTWFAQQSTLLRGLNNGRSAMRVINSKSSAVSRNTRIMPGKMFLYGYDPKYAAELPYYDKFPLVIPFRKVQDGFIGLNIHYLPLQLRFKLLGELLRISGDQFITEESKFKFSWGTVNKASMHPLISPCVHRYLNDHITTQIAEINPTDWGTVALLPVHNFAKKKAGFIWKQ